MNEFEAGVVLSSPSDAEASSLSLCRLWDVLDLCVHEHVLSTGTGASARGILIAAAHTAEMLQQLTLQRCCGEQGGNHMSLVA